MATLLILKKWRKSAVPLMLKDGPCSRAMWDFFFQALYKVVGYFSLGKQHSSWLYNVMALTCSLETTVYLLVQNMWAYAYVTSYSS